MCFFYNTIERETQKCFKCHRKFAGLSINLSPPLPMVLVPPFSYVPKSQVKNRKVEEDTHYNQTNLYLSSSSAIN